tara:strand:+ start:9195 stop:9374 length:180 start_codon:yes stop_codon:yes gene_type:complete
MPRLPKFRYAIGQRTKVSPKDLLIVKKKGWRFDKAVNTKTWSQLGKRKGSALGKIRKKK